MKLSKMVEVSDLERLDNDNKEDIINDNNTFQQNENKSTIDSKIDSETQSELDKLKSYAGLWYMKLIINLIFHYTHFKL